MAEKRKTVVLADKGVFAGAVFQCTKCHAVYLLARDEPCREVAQDRVCCENPFIVRLQVEEMEEDNEADVQPVVSR